MPGSTTTSVDEQGTATLDGTVSGPGGLVVGATVHIEHLVGGAVIPHDVQTGPDGRFALANVPGGAYRVRAYLPPALAQTTPDVRFVDDGKETTYQLTVEDQRKVVARAAVAPATPYVGDDVNLAVVVANQTVGTDGIVRSQPLVGLRVELTGLGAYQLATASPPRSLRGTTTTTAFSFVDPTVAFTDGNGQVTYALQCASASTPSLALAVTVTVTPATVAGQPPPVPTQQVQQLPLAVPTCIDPTTITSPPSPRTTQDTTQANGLVQ